MGKKHVALSLIGSFTIAASLMLPIEADAEEIADFQNLGTFNTPSLTVGSVTVTGSNNVNVLNLNGLGIVGGAFNNTIDPGETISFSFADQVSNVRIVNGCASGDRNGDGLQLEVLLEAFDELGASLGEVNAFPAHCLIDFSGALGVDPMSRLDVTMIEDGLRIGALAFDIEIVEDSDGDGAVDEVDNCPTVANADQADADNDGIGDACEPDGDVDGVIDDLDNCVSVPNSNQLDTDNDGVGDACDPDMDGDGVFNETDNCPLDANPDQADADGDGAGNLCDADLDGDGVIDSADACVPTQTNAVVNADGCSIADLVPCDAPWKNHGAYVSTLVKTAKEFHDLGLITQAERDDIVSAAAQSQCGQ